MNLCQKCNNEWTQVFLNIIRSSSDLPNPFPIFPTLSPDKFVPEQDCEWWAHKELNALNLFARWETNIFEVARKIRRELNPTAYNQLLIRLAGEETKTPLSDPSMIGASHD